MTKSRINIDNPADIDGDPVDVKRTIQTQLAQLASELHSYIEDVETQLSNAERTRILEEDPTMAPDELAERYENSDYAGQLARAVGAGQAFSRLTLQLAKETK